MKNLLKPMTTIIILLMIINTVNAQRGGSGYNPGSNSNIINCQSYDRSTKYCRANNLKSIKVHNIQSNRSSCKGNWGYSDQGIWVRRGCQAEFHVTYFSGNNNNNNSNSNRPDYNPGYNDYTEIKCESKHNKFTRCNTETYRGVQLIQTLSKTSCKNRWGFDRRSIWVKDGCRGKFRINR